MAFEIPEPHPHHAQHLSLGVALTALALTVAFHFLLAEAPYGFSFAIFAVLLVAGVHVVAALAGKGGNAWAYVFLAPVAFLVAAESLYTSPVVRVFAFPLVAVSLALFGYWRTGKPVPFRELPGLFPRGFLPESFLPVRGLSDFFAGFQVGKRWVQVLLGAALALPFLIVIGALFVSADKLFGQAVFDLLDVKRFPEIFAKLVRDWIVLFVFIGAGWTMLTRALAARAPAFGERSAQINTAIAGTFLTLLNLLFAVFLGFQAVYFFGGEAFVQAHGLTYADYARSGFFQLLAVSGIVFAIVWGFYRFTGMKPRLLRALNVALILQTGVVIFSAVRRLLLYIDAFGLTVSRWWAMAVILLIALVLLAVLVGAIMRWKYAPLANAVVTGALLLVSGSFLADVTGIVARTNVDRFLSGKTERLDIVYLTELTNDSSEAVPALVALYGRPWPDGSAVVTGGYYSKARIAKTLRLRGDGLSATLAEDWRRSAVADYRAIAAIGSLPSHEDLDAQLKKEESEAVARPASTVGGYTPDEGVLQPSVNDDYLLGGRMLRSLKGRLPETVTGDLSLEENGIKSLEGLPKTIGGDLYLQNNDLTSLVGMPEAVGGHLNLSRNPLESLEGLPKTIGGVLYLYDIPARSIPAGINIRFVIRVHSWQVELIRDAQAKGYSVSVTEGVAI